MLPMGTDEAGNDRGGTEPWFRVLRKEWTSGRLVMNLTAQTKLEESREKLYVKAKTRRLLSTHACT